ncbi:MAG: aspartate 1-decarboxylase [Candidatus Omnitrophica bacterium]|nr:aspartate 1-decarboxylase [Candidatus Omnitrophota bacterium]
MQRQILHGKIHNATVTGAREDYEGSITIDADLLKASDILAHEKVLVANVTNGARIESYAIEGPAGSGVICLNGGAAKHGKKGDTVIIMSFVVLDETERRFHHSKVVKVNKKNQIIQ